MTEQWRLRRLPDDEVDDDLETAYVRDAINPFANKAEVTLDDPDGTKRDEYPRPTLVELDVRIPGIFDWARRFAGFVQDYAHDRNETELVILSHDFWLRKRNVDASYEDETLSAILEDIITRFTPLIWDPALINIENDDEITRQWGGQPIEVVLEEIRTISGGDELFGATFDREFYFRPLGNESASRQFVEGEYSDTEWDQDGKRAANRASVRYFEDGEDERVVTENNLSAQRALQEAIGSDSRVEIEISKNRQDIESEARARDFAKKLLEERSELLTGRLETWEAFAVLPGQLTTVVDSEQEVDDEFRVAQTEFEWPGEPTLATVAEKAIDTVDELVELSDEVQRLDLQGTDADAPRLEAVEERSGAILTASANLTARVFGSDRAQLGFGRDALGFGRAEPGLDIEEVRQASTESARVTRPGLNAVRDGWRGDELSLIRNVSVGSGTSSPSRNDIELDELIAELPATISLIAMDAVRFSSTTRFGDETDVAEVGLVNSDLYARVVTPGITAPAQAPVDVTVEIAATDDEGRRGVLTRSGGQTVRDILADNDPATPVDLAFGTGDESESVDDTALEAQVAAAPIDFEEVSRTRGVGSTDVIGRLDEPTADNEEIAELGQLADDGTALTRIVVGAILKSGFELEANQRTTFTNP